MRNLGKHLPDIARRNKAVYHKDEMSEVDVEDTTEKQIDILIGSFPHQNHRCRCIVEDLDDGRETRVPWYETSVPRHEAASGLTR